MAYGATITPFSMTVSSQHQPTVTPGFLNKVKTFLTSLILHEDWKVMEDQVFKEGKIQFNAALLTSVRAGIKNHDIVVVFMSFALFY